MQFVFPLSLMTALSLAGASLQAEAPQAAPPKALTGVADLRRLFADPPNEYRILPLLRMNDDIDPEELRWQIHSMKEQGCGGTFSYSERFLGGMPQRFLSDAWWQVVRWTAEACEKEGLQYWAYDEEDWPSGAAGGLLLEKHPELGWKYLQPAEHQFDGPTQAEIAIGEGQLVAALAFQSDGNGERAPRTPSAAVATAAPQSVRPASAPHLAQIRKDTITDLTDRVAGRRLTWPVPPGRWTVAVYTAVMPNIGWQNRGYPDMMDPRTTAAFIDLVYKGHDDQVRKVPGARLFGFFLDEPSLSLANYPAGKIFTWYPAMPFSPALPQTFRKLYGYDWRTNIPLLYHDAGPQTVRFRIHHWDACRHMYSENYFGSVYRFCDEHGQRSSGHVHVEENFQAHLSLQGGNILAHFRNMHIPGIDWIHPFENELPAVVPKYSSSVSHLLGRDRAWCESFAACGYGATLQQYRRIVNWEHVNGINMLIPICYKYSLRGPNRTRFYNPGISYQQPYWDHFRAFADSEARLCVLTSGGGHVAQIALAYPSVDMQAHCWDEKLLQGRSLEYNALGDRLRAAGYDFDVLDDRAIVDESRVADGRLVTPTESFPVLIMPRTDAVRRETVARCLALARDGGTVLFVGSVPVHTSEYGADDPDLAKLIRELLGSPCSQPADAKTKLWRSHGKGRAGFAPTVDDVPAMLREVVPPDVSAPPGTKEFFAWHRQLDGGHLYLLFNRTDAPRTLELALAVRGQAERWDPLTGEVCGLPPGDAAITPQGTRLRLEFAAQELIPILLRPEGSAAPPPPAPQKVLKQIAVPGPFRFRIEETLKRPHLAWNFTQEQDGWKSTTQPVKAPETIPAGDWSLHGLAAFSGIGHYETDFTLDALPEGARLVLDLGRVAVSAEVFVNDARAGLVVFDPYRIDITRHVHPGRNRLRVAVANTLANYYSQFKELLNAPNSAGGVTLEQRVSGLLGPVTLKVMGNE